MSEIHPLGVAYLEAAAVVHRAKETSDGHAAPPEQSTPAMRMHRALIAWQAAGCPVKVGVSPNPVAVPCTLTNNDGWTGPGVVLRVTPRYIFAAPKQGDGHGLVVAYSRKAGKSAGRRYWRGISVVDPDAAAAAWLRANGVVRDPCGSAP